MAAAVERVTGEAKKVLTDAAGVSFLLGLSGGKTPEPVFRELASRLDLQKTECFMIDERNVPWIHESSNYAMVKNALYSKQPAALSHFHDFQTELPEEQTLKKYAAELESLAPSGFDLLLLGAGNDGHFASVFPGFQQWQSEQVTWATQTDNFMIRQRYTISPSYLRRAKRVLLLLSGLEKRKILDQLLEARLSPTELPINFWAEHPGLEIFYGEF